MSPPINNDPDSHIVSLTRSVDRLNDTVVQLLTRVDTNENRVFNMEKLFEGNLGNVGLSERMKLQEDASVARDKADIAFRTEVKTEVRAYYKTLSLVLMMFTGVGIPVMTITVQVILHFWQT